MTKNLDNQYFSIWLKLMSDALAPGTVSPGQASDDIMEEAFNTECGAKGLKLSPQHYEKCWARARTIR
jgi:truncated hemoglobin YjbI